MVNPPRDFPGENETEDYFLNDYLPLQLANERAAVQEREAHIRTMLQRFPLRPGANHLDVGCALGSMLEVSKSHGWLSVGVETSQFAARYAAERTGCQVHAGVLRSAGFAPHTFDVVTLMDVIEHVPHPSELMVEIFRLLRPNGIVYIVTPNASSLCVRLLRSRAYGIWPEHHVIYFNPASMKFLLRAAGFREIVIGTKDVYPENLRVLMGATAPKNGSSLKGAFSERAILRKLRAMTNRILFNVLLGDKLIAMARK